MSKKEKRNKKKQKGGYIYIQNDVICLFIIIKKNDHKTISITGVYNIHNI